MYPHEKLMHPFAFWRGIGLEQQLDPDSAHSDDDDTMSKQRRVVRQRGSLT
jgi:hypothetical protein